MITPHLCTFECTKYSMCNLWKWNIWLFSCLIPFHKPHISLLVSLFITHQVSASHSIVYLTICIFRQWMSLHMLEAKIFEIYPTSIRSTIIRYRSTDSITNKTLWNSTDLSCQTLSFRDIVFFKWREKAESDFYLIFAFMSFESQSKRKVILNLL